MHWGIILRNILSNWASYFVTAGVGFALAPFILHRLGNTGYGLWTLVLSLTGYFGLLDLGIRSSVGRFVARYLALNDEDKTNRTVSSALAILASGGALALLATVVVVKFFFGAFSVEPEFVASGKAALLISGLNMALILPLGVFSSTLIALERYDVISGVTIAGELLRAALVVWSLKQGYGLVALASIVLLVTILQYSAMAIAVRILYRPLRLAPRYVHRRTLGELFGFGVFRFITIVATQMIFYSSSVVIGIFLGASSITYYAIAATLINYGRNVVSLVTDTLFPAAARMDAREDLAGLRKLLAVGTQIAVGIALPLCLGYIFLGAQFITLWMGKEYVSSAGLLMVLTIGQFCSMSQNATVLVLSGMAKHRVLAYLALAEGVANVALSLFLVGRLGLIGVAWAMVIPSVVNNALIVPAYAIRILKLSPSRYLADAYLRPLLCAAPVALLGYALSVLVRPSSWLLFAAEALAMCGVFAAMASFVCLDGRQRAAVADKVGSFFRREPVVHEV